MTSNGPAVIDPRQPGNIRVTLPQAPQGVKACFKKSFPEIPDRDLTQADVVRIIGQAKILDRVKSACGDRASQWIETVRSNYAR